MERRIKEVPRPVTFARKKRKRYDKEVVQIDHYASERMVPFLRVPVPLMQNVLKHLFTYDSEVSVFQLLL